jgi:hypothetical protein
MTERERPTDRLDRYRGGTQEKRWRERDRAEIQWRNRGEI